MDEIYANVDYDKSVQSRGSAGQTGVRESHRTVHAAAVVCLGLLSVSLLVGLIGLGLHHHYSVHGAAAELKATKNNLTEVLQDRLSSVAEERDRLKAELTAMTEQRHETHQCRLICPAGWDRFGCSCYHVSNESKSWRRARDACAWDGADLVVVDSAEEQTFITALTKEETWIGLSDIENEGTWQWVDGSSLTVAFWLDEQPDNGKNDPKYGEEDCVHIRVRYLGSEKWNDISCEVSLPWLCEKKAVLS